MPCYTVYVQTTEEFEIDADTPEEAMAYEREGAGSGCLTHCRRWVELDNGDVVEDDS